VNVTGFEAYVPALDDRVYIDSFTRFVLGLFALELSGKLRTL